MISSSQKHVPVTLSAPVQGSCIAQHAKIDCLQASSFIIRVHHRVAGGKLCSAARWQGPLKGAIAGVHVILLTISSCSGVLEVCDFACIRACAQSSRCLDACNPSAVCSCQAHLQSYAQCCFLFTAASRATGMCCSWVEVLFFDLASSLCFCVSGGVAPSTPAQRALARCSDMCTFKCAACMSAQPECTRYAYHLSWCSPPELGQNCWSRLNPNSCKGCRHAFQLPSCCIFRQ